VARVVRFAAEHDLLVDVRATGHGAAPIEAPTLLVHTGALDEVSVHPEGWARIGAGVRWQQVLDAAAPFGLAPLCGSAPGVGVVGYLTGGGLGPVARTFGLSSDAVRAFEVVTGDGQIRRASPTQNPALFWGLTGGKGTLGIVTAVELDLPAVPELYAGCLVFDGADARAVLHAWARWTDTLPEQASTSVALQRLPDAPGIPAPLAGRCTLAVRFAWVGDPEDGARAFAPMAAVAAPVLGGVGVMPYAAIGGVHADPVDPMPTVESTELLSALPAGAVDALLAVAGPDVPCPHVVVELRLLGGALARFPQHPGAVPHRGAAFSLLAIGIAVPPLREATAAGAAAISAAVGPWCTGGALPNFGGALTAVSAARAYDARTLQRLASLADSYDPQRVLAGARAVRTAAAGS
jgi:hypothetical protein